MLFLAYTFETTEHANAYPERFWPWMADRNAWFYEGLDTVVATSWRIEHRPEGPLIHHEVAFADEAGLTGYRAALAARGRDLAWEQRRREQDRWYRIVSRSIQTSPPVPMAFPHRPAARHRAAADGLTTTTKEKSLADSAPAPWFLRDLPAARAAGGPVPRYSVEHPASAFRASARPLSRGRAARSASPIAPRVAVCCRARGRRTCVGA
ncbi:hypothetical protein ABZ770_42065 [Streptomyces sp. NPDC006654]|uniref:hypothetical protein n=1 Tax=Streptomyces sp. NPDC006654 TaxID=3156897 RepID=UPI0033C2B96B